jgi:RHS repeat-associated protein
VNGNRLTENAPNVSYTYAWDGRNRLSSITDGNGNRTSFKYDFARNLTEIDRTGTGIPRQQFVFDGLTNVASLTDASGLPVTVLTGRSVDSHFGSVDSAGNVTFGIGDPLNSSVAATGSSGSVGARLDFEPYGETSGTGPVAFPFSYTGRIPILGNLIYYRNRFYDAGTGRFISEDPLGWAGSGTNLAMYAGDNPIKSIDPYGLCCSQSATFSQAVQAIYYVGRISYGIFSIASGSFLVVTGAGAELTVVGIPLGVPLQTVGLIQIASGTLNVLGGFNGLVQLYISLQQCTGSNQ